VRAFVTGGTGFVGAHLVRALVARGDTVTCLVRNHAKAARLEWTNVRTISGTLDDAASLRAGCAEADVVYHVGGAIAARDAADFMRVNRDATAKLLEAAQDLPLQRFLYVSSQAAGGPNPPGRPLDETAVPAPVSNYGRSKLAAELLVKAATVPWTIVRPPVVYGEWDRELLKVFKLAAAGVAPVLGDGRQELSVIYAGDLADAFIAAATAPAAANRLYYAAHPVPTTNSGLVRAIGAALGKRVRILPIPGIAARGVLGLIGGVARLAGRATVLSADKAAEFLAPAWTCRPDALQRDAGWQAQVDLEDGLARSARWYRDRGWL
jgi:nucleoside-diphosphate-sugar epimerase